MKPVYLSIQQEATGKRMKQLIQDRGYSVRDIQEAMGFDTPQAIYKWLSGKSLPNLDNFLILSRILHTSIEDILVVGGDIVVLAGGEARKRMQTPFRARNSICCEMGKEWKRILSSC